MNPNGLVHWRQVSGAVVASPDHNSCNNRDRDRPAASAAIC